MPLPTDANGQRIQLLASRKGGAHALDVDDTGVFVTFSHPTDVFSMISITHPILFQTGDEGTLSADAGHYRESGEGVVEATVSNASGVWVKCATSGQTTRVYISELV